jgi:hypothetical protein
MADGQRQAQLLSQGADQRGNRAAFDIEQGPTQHARPLSPLLRADRIEVSGKNIAVTLELFGLSRDILEAMKPLDRSDMWA